MELGTPKDGTVSAAACAGDDEPVWVDKVGEVRVELSRYPSVGRPQIGQEVVASGFGKDAVVRCDEGPLPAEGRFEKPWAERGPRAADLKYGQWEFRKIDACIGQGRGNEAGECKGYRRTFRTLQISHGLQRPIEGSA